MFIYKGSINSLIHIFYSDCFLPIKAFVLNTCDNRHLNSLIRFI